MNFFCNGIIRRKKKNICDIGKHQKHCAEWWKPKNDCLCFWSVKSITTRWWLNESWDRSRAQCSQLRSRNTERRTAYSASSSMQLRWHWNLLLHNLAQKRCVLFAVLCSTKKVVDNYHIYFCVRASANGIVKTEKIRRRPWHSAFNSAIVNCVYWECSGLFFPRAFYAWVSDLEYLLVHSNSAKPSRENALVHFACQEKWEKLKSSLCST